MKVPQMLSLVIFLAVSLHINAQNQFSFTPDSELRKQLTNNFWQNEKNEVPVKYNSIMKANLTNNAAFNYFDDIMKNKGHAINDVSTSNLFFISITFNIIYDKDLFKGKEKQLLESIQNSIEKTLVNQTDNNKQKLADTMILKAMMIANLYKIGKSKSDKEAVSIAKKLARKYFVDLYKLNPEKFNIDNPIANQTAQKTPKESKNIKTKHLSKKKLNNTSTFKGIAQVRYTTSTYNGTMMMQQIGSKIILLLKDGSAYTNLDSESPEYLNISQSKANEPEAWMQWKIIGKKLSLFKGNEEKSYSDWNLIQPKPKAYKLDGYYNLDWGIATQFANGNAVTLVSKGITFFSNGTFETSAYTATTSSQGRTSTASNKKAKKINGTYLVDGYTITLNYNDGSTGRKTIALANTSQKDGMLFLGSSYKFKSK